MKKKFSVTLYILNVITILISVHKQQNMTERSYYSWRANVLSLNISQASIEVSKIR